MNGARLGERIVHKVEKKGKEKCEKSFSVSSTVNVSNVWPSSTAKEQSSLKSFQTLKMKILDRTSAQSHINIFDWNVKNCWQWSQSNFSSFTLLLLWNEKKMKSFFSSVHRLLSLPLWVRKGFNFNVNNEWRMWKAAKKMFCNRLFFYDLFFHHFASFHRHQTTFYSFHIARVKQSNLLREPLLAWIRNSDEFRRLAKEERTTRFHFFIS